MKTAVISAMQEEMTSLLKTIENPKIHLIGGREFVEGHLWGKDIVAVFSRWGKVASASTVTALISNFEVNRVLFTGVAGGISEQVNIGDIVIGNRFYQHDMDARPMFNQYEIPLIHSDAFAADETMNKNLKKAADTFFKQHHLNDTLVKEFRLHKPKILFGAIASGDRFVSDAKYVEELNNNLPDVLCVEMEGAAIAQVCADFKMPFAVIRTISDKANEHAPGDFLKFLKEVASFYSLGILQNYFLAEY